MYSIGEMRKNQEKFSRLDKLGGRNLALPCTWKI
jgi:hypothetical protein